MIKFAIVGFGNIGKRHAKHILNNPEASLVAVCDINPSLKDSLPENMPFYESIESLLQHSDADVVNICTPNYLHCTQAILVLDEGRHVVVEKPMALCEADCSRMIAAAQKNERLIFAVKQNRYNPPVQAVKQLIAEGSLGRIFMIQVNCFWNRSEAYYLESSWRGRKERDGGCLFTQFSHFIDILYYLNGDIETFSGITENFNHQQHTEFEDSGVFSLKAVNGALVNFNFTTCSYKQNMEGSITILSEKGTVKIGGQYLNTIEYQNLSCGALPKINITAKENDYGLYKGSMSNHDQVIQNVIDVLQHDGVMMTTAEDGLHVVRIIEEMYANAKQRGS